MLIKKASSTTAVKSTPWGRIDQPNNIRPIPGSSLPTMRIGSPISVSSPAAEPLGNECGPDAFGTFDVSARGSSEASGILAPPKDWNSSLTSAEVSPVDREEFYRALKKNDLAKLAQIYADDYVLVRPDRSVLSKTQILDDLETHSMTFRSKNEKVRIYGPPLALWSTNTPGIGPAPSHPRWGWIVPYLRSIIGLYAMFCLAIPLAETDAYPRQAPSRSTLRKRAAA